LDSDLVAYQNTYAPQLAQLTQQGNTSPAFEIFAGFNERVRDRLAWIKKRLLLPFDFSSERLQTLAQFIKEQLEIMN
jgi:hypothetical protein